MKKSAVTQQEGRILLTRVEQSVCFYIHSFALGCNHLNILYQLRRCFYCLRWDETSSYFLYLILAQPKMTTRDTSSFQRGALCSPRPHLSLQRGTAGLDADIGMRWESIEAYKNNFTSRHTARKASSPSRRASVYVCAKSASKQSIVSEWRKEPRRLPLLAASLSDLGCSSLLKCPSVPCRAPSFPPSIPSGMPPKISSVLHQTSSWQSGLLYQHQHFAGNVWDSDSVVTLIVGHFNLVIKVHLLHVARLMWVLHLKVFRF